MKEKLAEEAAKRTFPELEHIINNHLTDVRKIWRDGFEAGWEAKEASIGGDEVEKLRDKFLKECTELIGFGIYKHSAIKNSIQPNDLFNWFKKELLKELNSPLTKGEG